MSRHPSGVITQFTTMDGIVTFTMDVDTVRVSMRADNGALMEFSMPAFKFNWAVKDFKSYIMPPLPEEVRP